MTESPPASDDFCGAPTPHGSVTSMNGQSLQRSAMRHRRFHVPSVDVIPTTRLGF